MPLFFPEAARGGLAASKENPVKRADDCEPRLKHLLRLSALDIRECADAEELPKAYPSTRAQRIVRRSPGRLSERRPS